MPHTLKNNKAVVLAAVQQSGNALRHASPTLRDNPKIVLAAVQSLVVRFDMPQMSSGIMKPLCWLR